MRPMVLYTDTKLPGMSDYLLALKDAWRAIDALGGSYTTEEKASGWADAHARALERALSLDEDEIFKVQLDEHNMGFFRVPEVPA